MTAKEVEEAMVVNMQANMANPNFDSDYEMLV